ncbi:hypothetical protein CQ010_13280 [Arthrobacter sp. MYb211]|nr:hypothetical protein CQ019_10545 [Arthrobacter sp. MYb229]PRA10702.1 hypothetical protein CQ015_13270 [Arthrobacter sp. MYb221]PRB51353.1 hypothetical protein CQ013_06020 [Arthrobacter sp. MYb216]PRC06396.1 hypothetical protein CQ010_13280 [Arthrobacter sp. MYb211]
MWHCGILMSHAAHKRLTAGRMAARLLIVLLSLALTIVLVAHRSFPERGGLGLFLDNLAPWLGLGVPLLFCWALAARGRISFLVLLLPLVAWSWIFGAAFLPANAPEPAAKFIVATQNVHEDGAHSSAQGLLATGADLISLQELGEGQAQEVAALLEETHPHQYTVGTVGVYSKYPILDEEPLDLGLGWSRAVKLRVRTDAGDVTVYAVHVASARPLEHAERDLMLSNLGRTLAADRSAKIIALGDFNATNADRHFSPVSEQLNKVPHEGWGFGMTWPNRPMPMLGIDHVLVRGLDTGSSDTLAVGDSDHRAVIATLDLASE